MCVCVCCAQSTQQSAFFDLLFLLFMLCDHFHDWIFNGCIIYELFIQSESHTKYRRKNKFSFYKLARITKHTISNGNWSDINRVLYWRGNKQAIHDANGMLNENYELVASCCIDIFHQLHGNAVNNLFTPIAKMIEKYTKIVSVGIILCGCLLCHWFFFFFFLAGIFVWNLRYSTILTYSICKCSRNQDGKRERHKQYDLIYMR